MSQLFAPHQFTTPLLDLVMQALSKTRPVKQPGAQHKSEEHSQRARLRETARDCARLACHVPLPRLRDECSTRLMPCWWLSCAFESQSPGSGYGLDLRTGFRISCRSSRSFGLLVASFSSSFFHTTIRCGSQDREQSSLVGLRKTLYSLVRSSVRSSVDRSKLAFSLARRATTSYATHRSKSNRHSLLTAQANVPLPCTSQPQQPSLTSSSSPPPPSKSSLLHCRSRKSNAAGLRERQM
jgi:hypothetical protein